MQNIQDKEFDQLFRDKFEEAEITPPAHLWGNIETQLAGKPRRVFPVYWIAAALCAAALTAGLLFRQPENRQGTQLVSGGQTAEHLSANRAVPADDRTERPSVSPGSVSSGKGSSGTGSSAAGSSLLVSQSSASLKPASFLTGVRSSSLKTSPAGRMATAIAKPAAFMGAVATDIRQDVKKDLTAMQPLTLIVHPDYNTASVRQKKERLPEPAKETQEEVMLASTAMPPAVKTEGVADEDETGEKHRGIRNVGDLVNYVVNKVDKREEKFLKFKTDDDNSSLIGINIGMIRFNKKGSHRDDDDK